MYVKVCNANAIATDGIYIGVPVGLVGGPRPYQDQFRRFKSRRVHARRGFFLHKQIDQRKARDREVATFDENRRAVGMLDPMRDKTEARPGGEKGRTCDNGLSSLEVC